MKTKEMIEALEKKGYEIKEPESRFLRLRHSDRKFILLEDEEGGWLVRCWFEKENLNDFECFEKENLGHFWIKGGTRPFEMLINGVWRRVEEKVYVRFLRE